MRTPTVPTSSFCVVLAQFLIVNEVRRSAPVTSDPDSDDCDDDEDCGCVVRRFVENDGRLAKPKLIISVIYDTQNFFMNRRLLKSILPTSAKLPRRKV